MNVIAATDLLFPGRQDPVGWPEGFHRTQGGFHASGADPARYVVWVDAGRPYANARSGNPGQRSAGGSDTSRPELAPRIALHLVACRNGAP